MPVESPQTTTQYYRFCPGEEHVKLSDAICLARRRGNFPKCRGCQFNDDEQRSVGDSGQELSASQVERLKREMLDRMFRPHDVRALVPEELDSELAWRIGQATAQFLRAELRGYDRGRPEKAVVVVGRDMRRGSEELASALMEGIRAGGSPVVDIGMVDTPQLYFAVNQITCCGGVQVTGSSSGGRYNGFKFCGERGKPFSLDTGLGKVCKIARNTLRPTGNANAEQRQQDLREPYRRFVRSFVKATSAGLAGERPLRVVVDASNGMAGRWFPLLFGELDWLEVIRLNFEHNGEFVHDPDPAVPGNLNQLRDRVQRSRADFGACFDGDADRLILVDGEGHTVPGDLLTALLARHLLREFPGSTVVYDVRSSRVVPEEIRKAGGVPRRERCGQSFMKKAVSDAKALFGGEINGHYYFRENWCCDSGPITFAQVLNLVTSAGKTLAELVAPLRRYAGSGELSFHCDDIDGTLKRLSMRYAGGQIDFLDGITVQFPDWWFNVRPAGTEPGLRLNLEAHGGELLQQRLAELTPLLGEPVGTGGVV